MQQYLMHETDIAGTGSQKPIWQDQRSDESPMHRVAGIFHNLPSPTEKLTDGTLPLAWPAAYLDHPSSGEAPWVREHAAALPEHTAALPLPEDYAQLMRKLKADSFASQSKPQVDRALCLAHYISTLIAALAFIAMMSILLVTCLPTLLPS